MGTRKLRAKKYKSVYEYYKDSDPDKKTIAHYISYWEHDSSHKNGGTTKKERVDTLDPTEALKLLNKRKEESEKKKIEREELEAVGSGAVFTIDQVATEYFKERKKVSNLHKDMMKYVRHMGNCLYATIDTNSGKGYRLTNDVLTYDVEVRGRGYVTRYFQRAEDDKSMNIGSVIIKDLNPDTLRRLILALEKKGLSAKTVAIHLNLLQAITNHAISEGYIVANPFKNKKAKVDIPKEERKRLFSLHEREEIFASAKKSNEKLYVLFSMLYYTGQRPKSIIGLRAKDIDLDKKQISIDSIKEQSGTFVPISDTLYPILASWIEELEPEEKLFDTVYDTLRKQAQKIFEPYNKGLDHTKDRHRWASMYSFRHTAATVMLAKTNNIKTVQTILNHSDPKVTAIYAKLLNDAKQEGVNVL